MVTVEEDYQVEMAQSDLLENANMGDLGVLQIHPIKKIKGRLAHLF